MKNMKSLIGLLGAVTLTGLSATALAACSPNSKTQATDLNNVIKNKNLGVIIIDITPTKTELLKGIKIKNPNTTSTLIEDDFEIKKTTKTTIETTIIISGVGKYQNNVTLIYKRETGLGKYIVNKNLDKIVMQDLIPNKAELLKAIKANNSKTAKNLKVSDFEIKTIPTPSATLTIINGIGDYKGDVILIYKRETDLGKYLVETNLDKIVMKDLIPNEAELLKAIKTKNATVTLTETDFEFKTAPSGITAIITGKGNYKNDVTLTYARENDLGKYLVETNLDKIVMNGATPSKAELLAGIKAKNPITASNFTVTDFEFKQDTTPSGTIAVITGRSSYTGDVTLNYIKDTGTKLSDVIVTNKLDKIIMQDVIPTKVELLKGIKDKNATVTLTETDFKFKTTPSSTTAIITGKGNYKDDITLTYEKDIRTKLSDIIKNTNLDKIVMNGATPSKAEVLAGIRAKNPTVANLTENDFGFKTSPSGITAIITGIGDYKGDVTLTYEKFRTELSNFIVLKELDKIVMKDLIPTKAELFAGIKEKNPDVILTVDDFYFKTIPGATTAVITGIGDYKGDVTLTYRKDTRTDLSKITQLTGLNIKADPSDIYDNLWSTIILHSNELKGLLFEGYSSSMYATNDPADTTSIKDKKQAAGTIYIIFKVKRAGGINCFGTTPRLAVTLT